MAEKNAAAERGKAQAGLVVNNAFIDGLSAQIQEKMKYGLSFPPDYNYTNALMGAYLVLRETTDKNNKPLLESCSQASIANSLMEMTNLGLDVSRRQGYFIAYGGKCQFQRSYFGNITIARRYGMKSVNAEVIYDGDTFEYHIEDGVKVLDSHKQSLANINPAKIIGAYAVVTMQDGDKYLEVMTIDQIKQSWKQGYGYKEGSGTHSKFTDQMAKKTVINRALKGITNTHGDGFAESAMDETEYVSPDDAVIEDVEYDIEQNANQTDFPPEQEAAGAELPDFMRQGTE